jgi:hypothetical protein
VAESFFILTIVHDRFRVSSRRNSKLYFFVRFVHSAEVVLDFKWADQMTPGQQIQAHVLGRIVATTPEAFWRGYQNRARGLYLDAFGAVKADPRLNQSQRLSKLWQERHFAVEWLLIDEATQNGIPASDKLIVENSCAYALAGQGSLKMTQKYVRYYGALPSPAKFRKQLAAVNAFYRAPSLFLGDDPEELYLPPDINGIVLHSPVGTRFIEEHQTLGAIGFYVPHADFSEWAVELTFAEIIAGYVSEAPREDRAAPRLRPLKETGDDK